MSENPDFYIHEAEDIDLMITISDPNTDLGDITGATIVWVATGSLGGVPLITKGTEDFSIDIESPVAPHVLLVHFEQTDTRNLIGTLYYETSITLSGKRRVLREVGRNNGTFEIKQSDTDGVVVS